MCGVCGCAQAEMVLERGKPGETQAGGPGPAEEHVHDHGDGRGPHSHPIIIMTTAMRTTRIPMITTLRTATTTARTRRASARSG